MRYRNSYTNWVAAGGGVLFFLSCVLLSRATEHITRQATTTSINQRKVTSEQTLVVRHKGETPSETKGDDGNIGLEEEATKEVEVEKEATGTGRLPLDSVHTKPAHSPASFTSLSSSSSLTSTVSGNKGKTEKKELLGPTTISVLAEDCLVDRVVVYQDRADVTRIVEVEVQPGESEVVITGLTHSMQADSARVTGRGEATILEVVEGFGKEAEDSAAAHEARVKELNLKLRDAQKAADKAGKVADRKLQRLSDERGLVLSLAQRTATCEKESVAESLKAGGWTTFDELLSFTRERLGSLDKEWVAVEAEKTEIEAMVGELKVNLTELQSEGQGGGWPGGVPKGKQGGRRKRALPMRQVTVRVDAASAGPLRLELRYMTFGASWRPSYDCRGESDGDGVSASLLYHGIVRQSTGESWVGASLQLSTTQPSIGGDIPSLHPQNLDFVDQRRYHTSRPQRMMSKRAFAGGSARMETMSAMMDEGVMEEDESMEMAMDAVTDEPPRVMAAMSQSLSSVSEGTIGAVFTIAKRTTIPSDGLPHKVVIGVVSFPPSFEYISVPRAQPRAFLTARAVNLSPYPLLPGDLHVFLDGSATTTTFLPLVAPLQNFTVSFGVDEAVQVKQIPVVKLEEDKGMFFGETKKRTMHHKMSIANTKQTPITVEVRDNIPQSSQKELRVTITEKTTIGNNGVELSFEHTFGSHEVKWRCVLPAGSEQILNLKFTIEWPKDKEISGLPS
eukprot:CAMPEP_0196572524 /NCGR_PEP_ID=MMETSP1081-20130531/2567_1 /TAXON_ID=36882 /ORGANISM="Pyramimonas amylifera, Strain CCMP720" /LENGTH=732 /DNA_ID=CAMNT_0041889879 /DNA_START=72 /DNA_END=2270 /DNA_ORIENTATION=+